MAASLVKLSEACGGSVAANQRTTAARGTPLRLAVRGGAQCGRRQVIGRDTDEEDSSGSPVELTGSARTRYFHPRDAGRASARVSENSVDSPGAYLSAMAPDAARSLPAQPGHAWHLNVHGDNIGKRGATMEREHRDRFISILDQIANKILVASLRY